MQAKMNKRRRSHASILGAQFAASSVFTWPKKTPMKSAFLLMCCWLGDTGVTRHILERGQIELARFDDFL
jgi:hypothetical protein